MRKTIFKLFCTTFLLMAGFVTASAQDETFDLTADMFYSWNGYGADAASTGAATVDFNVGNELGAGAMVAGTSTVDYLIYADLTGCSKMVFTGTAGVQLRVLMNRQESNSGPLVEKNPTIGDDGTAELDLTEFAYVHLNAIKTGWGSSSGTITSIQLVKPSDPLAINKEQLKSALNHAKMQSAFAKTADSWNALQQAIADGEAALDSATDAESLDNAKDAIVNAEAALTLAVGYRNLTANMLFSWTGWDATAVKGNQAGCSYDLFKSTSQPYGDGSVIAFADLTGYAKLQIVSTGGTPRFLLNRDVDEGQWNENEAESHLIDNTKGDASSWHAKYFSQEGDVYTVNLAQLVADKGFAHLHAIKTVGGNVVVSGMYLYSQLPFIIQMAEMLDAEAFAAEIAAAKEAWAGTDAMALALAQTNLVNAVMPKANSLLADSEEFAKLYGYTELSEAITTFKADLATGDMELIQADLNNVIAKAIPAGQDAIAKIADYASVMNDEALNTALANAQAALASRDFKAIIAAVKAIADPFKNAAQTFVAKVQSKNYEDANVQAALAAVAAAMSAEEPSIVAIGDAIKNLIQAIPISDIIIAPETGADIAAALTAAKEDVFKVGNIVINLAAGGAYTISSTIEIPASLTITGNGATIDASALEAAMITTPAGDLAEWMDGNFTVQGVTIKGLKKALFASAGKNYLYNDFLIDNCVIEFNETSGFEFDFRKGGVAKNFTIQNSTLYAPEATNNSLYTSQSAQRATEAPGVTMQTFSIINSTLYNFAKSKNFFTHRQSNQTWLAYNLQNSIFVNCGKSGQVVKGINQGQSGKNPTWTIKGNLFNFDGADTSDAEATGDEEEPVQESVVGIVTFTDAAAGNFNGEVELSPLATAPATLGDPSWTLTFKEASELMKQAAALALDEEAVAVGKLIAAIDEAFNTGDESNLQGAINQFIEDNKDQEKDETAKVATNGWKNFNGDPAGVCATQFAPAITTYDGRTANLAEVFEGNGNRTGTIIYQDITGLENGTYKVGFYGNAFSTSQRDGFECTMEDGAEDVAYVFANDQKAYIVARIATSTTENDFRQFDVEVTDGNIKLGMGKDTEKSTNWHTMQIYQLTWFTTAKAVYAQDQDELKALVAEAKALTGDNGKEEFQAALTAAELGVGSNWYNITEIEEIIAKLKAAMKAYKKANWFIEFAAGEYYVIDAESDLKMAAGHDWGTRAIVNELGLDLTLTPNEETRTVTFDSKVSNGGDSHFLGSNLYMDAPAYGWALEYQGFGFYIVDPANDQYINLDADNNLVLSDTPREFIIVDKEGVYDERMDELAMATPDAPVDATFLLQHPNFNRNDQRVSAWEWIPTETAEENPDTWNNHNFNGGNNVNNCAESFHAAFTVKQTVEGAPKGMYALTAQGFYRQDEYEGEEAPEAPAFFANGVIADVPAKTGEENNMSAASESFTNGLYTIEPIMFDVTGEGDDAGKINVGVTATVHNQWVIFDNFKLLYYGPNSTTAISEVKTNGQQANEGIYNLSGQKVMKAGKGLYIINGKKVVK